MAHAGPGEELIFVRWRRLIITLSAVVSLILLLWYGFYRDPRYIPSPLVGQTAPDFKMILFDGDEISLESLRGKTVFLNFWASWCLPCREEARDLEAAWHGYKERKEDVVFLGINIQDKKENALAFIKEFGISFPNGPDPSGKLAVDYGVWGIPEGFFISPQGTITYKHTGGLPWPLLTAKLNEAKKSIVSAEGKGVYQSIK